MLRIWSKSLLCAGIAVVAAEAISISVRLMLGRPLDPVAIVLAAFIPLVVTIPIALFTFRQHARLEQIRLALVAANAALAKKASRDHLTGLLNRESFVSRADVARLSPAGGTLLIIDADHFKHINDRHGHDMGDQALCAIAAALSANLREQDFIGRIGGEEFAAFLVGAELPESLQIAQRLRAGVEAAQLATAAGLRVHMTVSVGGAVADGQPSIAALMRQADMRLYEAKRAGRNRVIIERGLTVAA